MVTRSEWFRDVYDKDAPEHEKEALLREYFELPYEGGTSDPGSEED